MAKDKPMYNSYLNAKRKCTSKTHSQYRDFGAKGIKWEFDSYDQWAAVVLPLYELAKITWPNEELSLQRVDQNGHFGPENIRWAPWGGENGYHKGRKTRSYREAQANPEYATLNPIEKYIAAIRVRDQFWYSRKDGEADPAEIQEDDPVDLPVEV